MRYAALAAILFALFSASANAATVTRTYSFTATDFTTSNSGILPLPAPPVDPVIGILTVTFDSADTANTIVESGVVVDSLNIAIDADIVLAHRFTTSGILQIGGIAPGRGFGATFAGDNDFFLGIDDALSATPGLANFNYSDSSQPLATHRTNTGTVDVNQIPLPAGLVLLLSAVGILILCQRFLSIAPSAKLA